MKNGGHSVRYLWVPLDLLDLADDSGAGLGFNGVGRETRRAHRQNAGQEPAQGTSVILHKRATLPESAASVQQSY